MEQKTVTIQADYIPLNYCSAFSSWFIRDLFFYILGPQQFSNEGMFLFMTHFTAQLTLCCSIENLIKLIWSCLCSLNVNLHVGFEIFMVRRYDPEDSHLHLYSCSQKPSVGAYLEPAESKTCPISLRSILILSSHICICLGGLFGWGFLATFCMHFSLSPCMLHAMFILYSFLYSP
jgi:hypothetical protein